MLKSFTKRKEGQSSLFMAAAQGMTETRKARKLPTNGGTAEDIKDVYGYFATGKLKPQLHMITLDEIPEGLERLHRGEFKGRLVAVR